MANIEFFGLDVPTEYPGLATPNTDWVPPAYWSKWDLFYVAGKVLPGKAIVTGKKTRRVDKKYSPGQDGATQTHLGNDLAEVDVKLVFWLKQQWDTLQRMQSFLYPLNNKSSPTPFDVSHPSLLLHRINSLYLVNVSLPKQEKENDVYAIELKFNEFAPTKKKNQASTPNSSLDLSSVQVAVSTVPISSDPTIPPSQTNSDASVAPPFKPSP